MIRRSAMLSAALLLFSAGAASAQQILFQCSFDGPGTGAAGKWSACGGTYGTGLPSCSLTPGVSGNAVSCTTTTSGFWIASARLSTASQEVTTVYYEKFSAWPLGNGNVKSIRPFYGSGAGNYMAASIGAHYNTHTYLSAWQTGDLTRGPAFRGMKENCACAGSGGGCDNGYGCCPTSSTGTCSTTSSNGTGGRIDVNWSTDGGATDGYGTVWRKVRYYIKVPSSPTTADGSVKLWMDDVLVYSIDNMLRNNDGGGNTTQSIDWFPSDEATGTFTHSYDEIVVYAGYVPPSGSSGAPPPATNLHRTDAKP